LMIVSSEYLMRYLVDRMIDYGV